MSSFASAFRELVAPDLARMCKSRGLFVRLGMDGWADAYGEIMEEARRRGALHLPDEDFRKLEDAISTALLQAVDAANAVVSEAERFSMNWVREHAPWLMTV